MAFNPRMITVARESRGLTQSELATLVDVSQGKLSKIEGGVMPPTEELIARMSTALSYPTGFFEQDDAIHGLGTDAHHQVYRRRKALPMRTLRMIEAQVNVARMHAARLLRAVDVETRYHVPQFDLEEFKGDVERIAAAVRAAWQMPSGPVHNLVAHLEEAGVLILPFDFGTDKVDATSVRFGDLPPIIFYNKVLSADRCRFTLAHELGHLVMHRLEQGPDMEEEADRFAAEFLMPARDIAPQLAGMSMSRAAQLKPYWKVSMASLIYRAKSLGKLSASQAQRLWISMNAAGYRTREPQELDFPLETPAFHKSLLDLHLRDLGFSLDELCQMLMTTAKDFASLHLTGATRERLMSTLPKTPENLSSNVIAFNRSK